MSENTYSVMFWLEAPLRNGEKNTNIPFGVDEILLLDHAVEIARGIEQIFASVYILEFDETGREVCKLILDEKGNPKKDPAFVPSENACGKASSRSGRA
jgi:hypothetical protein